MTGKFLANIYEVRYSYLNSHSEATYDFYICKWMQFTYYWSLDLMKYENKNDCKLKHAQ